MIKNKTELLDLKIRNNFKYHECSKDNIKKMEDIRNVLKNAALKINRDCPNSPEKDTAITKLEEVMFWANASLARE